MRDTERRDPVEWQCVEFGIGGGARLHGPHGMGVDVDRTNRVDVGEQRRVDRRLSRRARRLGRQKYNGNQKAAPPWEVPPGDHESPRSRMAPIRYSARTGSGRRGWGMRDEG